uniref:F-box/FBD/LRR-repeat protein At1g78760 n=1 Tax=Nicotiana tabacum TaxID=4097 RepID=A0A1S4AUR5_TOBAC|nr:PREDICTED: putative F-box/FBD/LRR-repeat protein At1g78760 [Nicotiana tabacum]
MAEIISDGEDRISELPVHIIHDILRRINVGIYGAKEEARTCVLSKTWNSIWRTRPNVIIQSIHRSFYKNLENFVKFVDDSLRTYAEQKLSIETLCLMHLDCPQELASHVDRWFNFALKLHVRYLCIDASMFGSTYYSIPDSVYAVNNTLTVLSLANCNIEIDNSTNKLQRLISTCPLIRDLRLTDCKGFQNFHVTAGLINLERLELIWCRELIKVKIGAPNLKNFVFVGVPLHKYPKTREPEPMPCTIDILDDSREIMIPPAQKLELLVKNPSMRLPSFVNDIMSSRPKIASVVHGIDCKIPQVFHESATTYTKKQYGRLKEVTNHKGVVADENGETSTFCTWLKSTSLIERITTFSFKWV